jgi:UDP-glucose 4-epimerase
MHFAALLSVAESVANPRPYYKINLVKGLAMLEAMEAASVRRLIFSSTCATYGLPVRVPMDETHPQDPINPYGSTKRAFERALIDHGAIGVVRSVALRYFNAAGCHRDGSLGEDHRPEEHVIPLAIDAALGRRPGLTIYGDDYDTPDGTCIRDYIHVEDLADAHIRALDVLGKSDVRTLALNLGTGVGSSVLDVIKATEAVAGKPVPYEVTARRPGDPVTTYADPTHAESLLGWRARQGLAEIVETAYRWHASTVGHPAG